MANHQEVRVKLTKIQLNKLKSSGTMIKTTNNKQLK